MPTISPIRDPTLIRGLGLIAATSIVIGNVIGTGVFLKSRVIICNVGTPGRVIGVWLVAGLLSLAGASHMPNWRRSGLMRGVNTSLSAKHTARV